MTKKILALIISVLFLTSLAVPTYAADMRGEVAICTGEVEELKSMPVLPNSEPRYEDGQIYSKVASVTVNVTEPVDQHFRSKYSSYAYEANRIVERVDDYLSSEFGIDFRSVAQPLWTSGSTDPETLLDDAMNTFGLKYEGSKKADIMMAFSGADTTTGSGTTFGIATVSQPYGCIFDHSYNQNCKSCQHEFGHTYGLRHHTASGNCVMKQGWDTNWDNFEHLCSTHWNEWNGAKSKY